MDNMIYRHDDSDTQERWPLDTKSWSYVIKPMWHGALLGLVFSSLIVGVELVRTFLE